MQIKPVVLFLLLLLAPCPATAADLRIATFNCEFLVKKKVHVKYGEKFDFDDWDPATRRRKFDQATAAVAKEVNKIQADVIVLTEVGNADDFKNLTDQLQFPHAVLCDSTDTATGQHVGIVSKIPLSNVLRQVPGRKFYRGEEDDPESERDTGVSKGLRVSLTFAGQVVVLYGLHLKSERGASEADNQRIAQASIVRRNYLPLLKAGTHVIVAGDLNDKRGDPAIRQIRGLNDIEDDLVQTGAPKFWKDNEQRWTYKFEGVRNQIDHILTSRSLGTTASKISATVHTPTELIEGKFPASDHRALIITIRF